MENYKSTDVFTPTKPAKLTFIERDEINEQLVDALRTPGKQIVLYGPSKSGKTTLLTNKLEQLYENHVTTKCTKETSFENLLLSAFDKLNPFYIAKVTKTKTVSIKSSLSSEYELIKAKIEYNHSRQEQTNIDRIIPPQLTAERLAEFMGEAKCCWVLEDFHKVTDSQKEKISQIMKVFMDSANDYDDVKIIAVGAVDTARQVIEYDREMENRVSEIIVPLMLKENIVEIINKGEDLLNFAIKNSIKNDIANYASGLAAICHQLCLNICFAAEINYTCKQKFKIEEKHLEIAIKRYLNDTSDTLKSIFDQALVRRRKRKYDNCKIILTNMANFGNEGVTHNQLLTEIQKRNKEYPASNLTVYLKELTTEKRSELLRYDSYSNRYHFSDPILLAYARCLFRPKGKNDHLEITKSEFLNLLENIAAKFVEKEFKKRGENNQLLLKF